MKKVVKGYGQFSRVVDVQGGGAPFNPQTDTYLQGKFNTQDAKNTEYDTKIGTLTQGLTDITLQSDDNKADIDALKPKVQNLENNAALKNAANEFTQKQTIKVNDEALTIKPNTDAASFIRFRKNNNTEIGYIGKATSQNDNLSLISTVGDITFGVPNNKSINFQNKTISNIKNPTAADHPANKGYVDTTLNGYAKLATQNNFTNEQILQGNAAKIEFSGTRDTDGYCIRFNMDNAGANKSVDLFRVHKAGGKLSLKYNTGNDSWGEFFGNYLFKAQAQVEQSPIGPTSITNKKYVDEKFSFVDRTATLAHTGGSNRYITINVPQGYVVASFEVYRKRNDTFWFSKLGVDLQYQQYIDGAGNFVVYNEGQPNNFTNEFRVIAMFRKQ